MLFALKLNATRLNSVMTIQDSGPKID